MGVLLEVASRVGEDPLDLPNHAAFRMRSSSWQRCFLGWPHCQAVGNYSLNHKEKGSPRRCENPFRRCKDDHKGSSQPQRRMMATDCSICLSRAPTRLADGFGTRASLSFRFRSEFTPRVGSPIDTCLRRHSAFGIAAYI